MVGLVVNDESRGKGHDGCVPVATPTWADLDTNHVHPRFSGEKHTKPILQHVIHFFHK